MALSSNLTVSIGADTSKLRADLEVAKRRLEDFGREVRAASRDVARGVGDPARLSELSQAYEQQARAVRLLNNEMKATLGLSVATGNNFRTLATHTTEWAKATAAAWLSFQGIRQVINIFRETAREITDIRNTAKASGATRGDVKIFTEAIRESGEAADGARQALGTYLEKIAETRTKMRGFRPGQPAGVTTLRGGEGMGAAGVQVVRGGEGAAQPFGGTQAIRGSVTALSSVADVVERIRENAARFPEARGQIMSGLKDLREIGKLDKGLATAAGRELFGARRYAIYAQALEKLGENEAWDKIEKSLKEQGRFPTQEAEDRVDAYNLAIDDLGDSFEKLRMAIAIPLLPQVNQGILALASFIENIDQVGVKYKELLSLTGATALEENVVGPVRAALIGVLDAVRKIGDEIPGPIGAVFKILAQLVKLSVDAITLDLSGAIRDFGVLVDDVFKAALGVVRFFADQVVGAARGVKDAYNWVVRQFQSTPNAEAAIPGRAAGGYIRGPGTGTSDSILARLSNGEFVMRAAAVQHWGAGLLSAMNAAGPRFAAGGLVSGGGSSTPVHLHLGGQSFALNGASNVVSALVTEAHRQHVKSAGVKPSWYGGR